MSAGDRLSSLDNLLGSRPSPRRTPPAAAAPSAPNDSDRAEPEAKEPRGTTVVESTSAPSTKPKPGPRERKAQPTRRGPAAAATRHRLPFNVPPELHRRWKDRARRDETTQQDVLKSAIEAAAANGSFEGAFTEQPRQGLFTRSSQRGSASPSVPSEIRLFGDEVDVVDALIDKHGAKDRTSLFNKALELYLA